MSKNNNKSVASDLIKIFVAVVITAFISVMLTVRFMWGKQLNSTGISYLSTKLNLVNSRLQRSYIYDLNEDKMMEFAVKGYVSGVGDEYTEYLTKEEMNDLMQSTSGSYVGIGAYLGKDKDSGKIVIIGIIDGSSAQEYGLRAGDIIKSVDGVEYNGDQVTTAASSLKSKEEGTPAHLVIIRDGKEINFEIPRRNIKLKSVAGEVISDNIGYIKVASFNDGTSKEFINTYKELKDKGISALVIDLRNNGGGLVKESLEIADTMVAKGNTTLITNNKANKEKVQKSATNPIIDVPVVILINENTASASEILAGALRDNCNYKIIGTNSYGKGVIQSIYNFADGTGIKVTTEEYFTPNHSKINKVGIKPDIEVELDEKWKYVSTIPFDDDLQLQRALKELGVQSN